LTEFTPFRQSPLSRTAPCEKEGEEYTMATQNPAEQQIQQLVPDKEIPEGFKQVLGQLIADPQFREAMASNPEQAVKDAGIQLSPQEMERLRSMIAEDRQRLFQQLDPRDSKAWWGWVWRWFTWWVWW